LFSNTHNIGAAMGVLHDRAGYYPTTQSNYMCPRGTDLGHAGRSDQALLRGPGR